MKIVCSRLNGGVQDGPGRTSKLGAKAIGLDLKFLDCIHRRANDEVRAIQEVNEFDIVVNAVQQVVVLRGTQAVSCKASTGPQSARVLLTLSSARRELSEKGEVAPVERKSVYGSLADHLPNRGILCLERRRFGVYHHRFRRLAGRQCEIDNHSLLHGYRDVILLDLLETFDFR